MQCKHHAYKTAEIILLCHKVLCYSVLWPLQASSYRKELSLQVWLLENALV